MSAPTEALEASYKATRLQLSRILAFRARLQEHGASTYATQVPQTMILPLKSEMDTFDQVCEELEGRVMRAIATLERDARNASIAVKPIKSELLIEEPPKEPLSTTSSAHPSTISSTSRQLQSGPETITLDDDPSDSLPQQSMELDLTLSPTPPASTSTSTLPAPPTSEPLPFALPTASTPSLNPSNLSAGADDLNALLSSLNMPPFDPNANANLNFLAHGGVTGAGTAGGGGSQTTEEALAALLGTNLTGGSNTTSSETNMSFNLPSTSGAPSSTTGGGGGNEQDLNLTGFDFSSISGLSTSLPPSSSFSAASNTTMEPQPNLGGFDFSKFDGNGLGLGGMDFSDLSGMGGNGGGFGMDLSGNGGNGNVGNGQMSEEEMQELLKSLGG